MIVHLKRAFGWNLGRVVPSERETAALDAAGVRDPAVQRYAAWRRSLLLVALVPMLLVAALSVLDFLEDGVDGLTAVGAALEVGYLLATLVLPAACVAGIVAWTRLRAGARVLAAVWLFAFLLAFVYSLLPSEALYHLEPLAVAADADIGATTIEDPNDREEAEKLVALEQMARDLVLSAAAFLLLLPSILSILPGAMNACLRVKSALPAAQLPGWLLVCVPPVFLLFWLTLLVLAGTVLPSMLLAAGIVLWAGGPLAYTLRHRVFVRSLIGPDEEARIARAKRTATLVSLAGIALLVTFLLTGEMAELRLVGTDPDLAMNTRLEMLDEDDSLGFWEMAEAYAESESLIYILDTKFLRTLIDTLAKLLLVTAVFGHLVMRATLSAWRNEQSLRARTDASAFDRSASAALASLAPPAASPARGPRSVTGDAG